MVLEPDEVASLVLEASQEKVAREHSLTRPTSAGAPLAEGGVMAYHTLREKETVDFYIRMKGMKENNHGPPPRCCPGQGPKAYLI